MKGIGATAAAGLGVKYVGSPVGDAEAIAPLIAFGAVGAGYAAVSYLANEGIIGGPDEEAVDGSLSYQNHLNEYTKARENALMLDQTLASLKRDVQLVENKAREEAIFKVFEAGVDNLDEATATANAQEAVDESFAVVQRSILTTWSVVYNRLKSLVGTSLVPTGSSNVMVSTYNGAGTMSVGGGNEHEFESTHVESSFGTKSVGLVDGQSVTIPYGYVDDLYNGWYDPTAVDPEDDADTGSTRNGVGFLPPSASDYSGVDSDTHNFTEKVVPLNTPDFAGAYQDLMTEYDAMSAEVSSIVSTYFTPAKNGEIDLYEAVGPKHLTETASTATDYQEASMALRAMGYPMSKQVVTISLPTTDGGEVELTGRLSWTAHQGNTLAVGQTHFAQNIPGSIYAAVNLPEGVTSLYENETNTTEFSDVEGPGAEITELTDEFTIVSAEGADGVSFESRKLASADNITNEEINQIFKENFTANKEATETVHDTATGGGGGALGLGLTDTQLGAALVAAAVGLGVISAN